MPRREDAPSRLAIAARIPLAASLPRETMIDLAHAFIGMTGIEPDEVGEALPCRLDHGVELDETDMPPPGAPCLRLRGRVLRIMGTLVDFDRPLTWSAGDVHYCAGTSVMSEAFAMLSDAADARPGDLLGGIARVGETFFSGPIVMTPAGIRWVPSALSAHASAPKGRAVRSIRSVPARLLSTLEGGESSSHASLDRKGLRNHLRCEGMKRAVRSAGGPRLEAARPRLADAV